MAKELNDNKFIEANQLLHDFKASEKHFFQELKPAMLEEDLAVVYAIFNKNTDEAFYVGRTKKLRQRLYTNHLQGNKSTARLKKYIVEDNETFQHISTYSQAKEWIRDNCYFKYLPVNESKKRGHIEGLIGYLLDSKYIEDEN